MLSASPLLLLLAWLGLARCLEFEVVGRLLSPSQSPLPGVRLALNTQHRATSRFDGHFAFHGIQPGIYLLEVLGIEYAFSQCKIKVDEAGVVTVVEYKYPGATRVPMAYPIVLTALAPVEYFQVREPFSLIRTLMANPLTGMGIVFMVVVVAFPGILKFDPETLEEAQAEMAQTMDTLQGTKK